MKKVLIADGDQFFLSNIWAHLESADKKAYSLVTANSSDEAIATLSDIDIDLVVTEITMATSNGLKLLDYVGETKPYIPVIAMSEELNEEIQSRLDDQGVFCQLRKPVDFDVVKQEIDKGLAAGATGHISGVALPSALQLVELDRKTCTLKVTSGESVGLLFFRNGDLMDARCEAETGLEAAMEIAAWDHAEIQFYDFCIKKEKIIQEPLVYVVMESARRKDEIGCADGESHEDDYVDELSAEHVCTQETNVECLFDDTDDIFGIPDTQPETSAVSDQLESDEHSSSAFDMLTDIPAEASEITGEAARDGSNDAEEPYQPFDFDAAMTGGPLAHVFGEIQTAFARAIGPVARMIFRDHAVKWAAAGSPSEDRLDELLDILSSEVEEDDSLIEFRNAVRKLVP